MKAVARKIFYAIPRSIRQPLQGTGLVETAKRVLPSQVSVASFRRWRGVGSATTKISDAFGAGEFEQVVTRATAAIRRFPEEASFYDWLAEVSYRLGRDEQAFGFARDAALLGSAKRETAVIAVRSAFATGLPRSDLLELVRSLPAAAFWEACKNCDSPDLLDGLIGLVRSPGEELPETAIRPLIVAATRAEMFPIARDIALQGIRSVVEGAGETNARTKGALGAAGLAALEDAVETLDAAGIPFFAAAGTALGIVREGAPLRHDLDIDIGVFERDFDQARIKAAFLADPKFLLDTPHDKNPKVGVRHRSGATLDVFKFYEREGAFFHDGVFVRWRNAPFQLTPRTVGRVKVNIPANEDAYLTENYGNWRVPDKTFDAFVNGPNREVIWPEYYGLHLLRGMFTALLNDNKAKAAYFASQVQSDETIPPHQKEAIARMSRVLA